MGPVVRGQALRNGLRVCSTTRLAWVSARLLLLLLLLMRCSRSSQLLPISPSQRLYSHGP